MQIKDKDKLFDDGRPQYLYCMFCGEPLDLLHTKSAIALKHIPIWIGCKYCQTVYFCGKYSPLSKTGKLIRIQKQFTYDEFKEQLELGIVPEDPIVNKWRKK